MVVVNIASVLCSGITRLLQHQEGLTLAQLEKLTGYSARSPCSIAFVELDLYVAVHDGVDSFEKLRLQGPEPGTIGIK